MSVLVVVLIAYALVAIRRECDLLERNWHALGAGPAAEWRSCRWTDANL